MLQALILGLWSCSVTVGVLLFGLGMKQDEMAAVEEMADKPPSPPAYTQPTMLVAPIVSKSQLSGYMFANLVLEMDSEVLESLPISLDLVLKDKYNEFMIGNTDFGFPVVKRFDIKKFKMGLRDSLNKGREKALVHEVYVNDVNFLNVQQVRSKQSIKSVWLQEKTDFVPAEPPKKKK